MNYEEVASEVLKEVGGKENVSSVVHCATRLRFNLKDDNIPSREKILNIKGVVGIVNKGGQYQVIIGNEVKEVYKKLIEIGNLTDTSSSSENEGENKGIITTVLDTISGIFVPIIPVLAGTGMIKAVISLISAFKLIPADASTYKIINFMGDAGYYFLPIIIACSAAKKFKCNQYIAMAIGGILLHPTFVTMVSEAKASGGGIDLLGLPVSLVTYSSSVIPIILAVWCMSYIEPFFDRVMPKAVRLIISPLCTLFVVGFLTLVAIGPIGNFLGIGLGACVGFLDNYVSWLVPTLVGTLTPLMVMTGMHYGLIPIGINMLASTGIDTVAGPGMTVSNIAQGGAALAVGIRSKNQEVKALGFSAGITAICGVTEPAMYGISLRFKKPLISAMIGGGAGGLFLGIMGVGRFAQVAPGLFALPSFIGPDGLNNFIYACIAALISFVVSFTVQLVLGIEDPVEETEESSESTLNDTSKLEECAVLYAPIKGKVIELKNVNDDAFASEALGKGLAIIPEEGKVYSPVDGVVTAFFNTCHAIGITSDSGTEILIHVGFDTVEMGGRNFNPKVKQGDKIKKGDLMLEFDKYAIIKEGYDVTTPIVVTNSHEYNDFVYEADKDINVGDMLLDISR